MQETLAKGSPLPGVAIQPSDIANGMLYLASDMGRCVNVRLPGGAAADAVWDGAVWGRCNVQVDVEVGEAEQLMPHLSLKCACMCACKHVGCTQCLLAYLGWVACALLPQPAHVGACHCQHALMALSWCL